MSLPVERLISAQQKFGIASPLPNVRGAPMQPVVDEDTLPELPLDAIKRGSADNVVVLAGSNLEEAKLFAAMDQSLTNLDEAGLIQRVQRLLPPEYVTELIESYRDARVKRGAASSPADIVTPARETPGMMARLWARPMKMAWCQRMSAASF